MRPFGATGLAVATSLASLINFSLLVIFLKKHLGPFPRQMLVTPLQKTGLAGLSMAASLVILRGLLPSLDGRGVFWEFGGFLGELGIGTLVFLGVAAFLGSDEVQLLRRLFQRRLT
jgi:peptidoglycan biosynthesis protein MviN/MurJ (putative lipid II flippase)